MKRIENLQREIIAMLDEVMKVKYNRELTTNTYMKDTSVSTYIRHYNEFIITITVHNTGIVKYDLRVENKSYYTLNFRLLLKTITGYILTRE